MANLRHHEASQKISLSLILLARATSEDLLFYSHFGMAERNDLPQMMAPPAENINDRETVFTQTGHWLWNILKLCGRLSIPLPVGRSIQMISHPKPRFLLDFYVIRIRLLSMTFISTGPEKDYSLRRKLSPCKLSSGISGIVADTTVTPQLTIPPVSDLAPTNHRSSSLSEIVVSGFAMGILLACVLSGTLTNYTSG